ncbi:MAG: citrate/2-methylcitrate synthase [Oligoflexia bacterium]|nr:citrate/2-methylcitrate synthase [Oligoflexia bacterium]
MASESKVEVYDKAIDKGLEGIVACTTAVSSIVDATLTYAGYTIDDLSEHSTFEETTFLLWNKRFPKVTELEKFKKDLAQNMILEKEYVNFLKGLPNKNVHPMEWLRTAVSGLALWDKEATDISAESNQHKALRLTAKMGPIVAALERFRTGQQLLEPKLDKSLAWNFLYLLKGKEPDPYHVKVFDTALILHADHELNCSAFSVRVTTSSLSDLHSAITSGIGTLKGPLHGGANEQVMKMLLKIGNMKECETFVKNALENKEKVMGFGHRVYKNGDPRARILKSMSQELGKRRGEPQWYDMSVHIDDIMQDKKGLLPNVDFYSASVYYCLDVPIDLYTPIFAVSRISGWIAHAFEQYANNRIYRPRGHYSGNRDLKWVAPDKR